MLLSLKGNFPPAILALADGTVFLGNSIGALPLVQPDGAVVVVSAHGVGPEGGMTAW